MLLTHRSSSSSSSCRRVVVFFSSCFSAAIKVDVVNNSAGPISSIHLFISNQARRRRLHVASDSRGRNNDFPRLAGNASQSGPAPDPAQGPRQAAALTSLVKRGTPRCQRWSFSRPLYTTFPKTAMLPDLHNVFPAGTRRRENREAVIHRDKEQPGGHALHCTALHCTALHCRGAAAGRGRKASSIASHFSGFDAKHFVW